MIFENYYLVFLRIMNKIFYRRNYENIFYLHISTTNVNSNNG
jgi:hypothetical protein